MSRNLPTPFISPGFLKRAHNPFQVTEKISMTIFSNNVREFFLLRSIWCDICLFIHFEPESGESQDDVFVFWDTSYKIVKGKVYIFWTWIFMTAMWYACKQFFLKYALLFCVKKTSSIKEGVSSFVICIPKTCCDLTRKRDNSRGNINLRLLSQWLLKLSILPRQRL